MKKQEFRISEKRRAVSPGRESVDQGVISLLSIKVFQKLEEVRNLQLQHNNSVIHRNT